MKKNIVKGIPSTIRTLYCMTCDKELEPNRLCQCPESSLEILCWMIKVINNLPPLGSGQTVKDMMRDEVVRKYKSITGIDIPKLKCTCGAITKDGHTPDCELNQ